MPRMLRCFLLATALLSTPAFAADDALTALLRRQTDAGSNAGQAGDQATVNGFLDDRVLFSGGDGDVDRDAKFDASDDVAMLIRQQTEALRAPAMPRALLGDKLQFIDEHGVLHGKRDLRRAAPGASPAITDWVLHHTNDVAAASFVETVGSASFRVVEAWHRDRDAWTLVGSETIPLHKDPATVVLPPAALDDYVGQYSAGPGSEVSVARDGDHLTTSANAAKPMPLATEARDVFFTPGLPSGYLRPRAVFQRDANGTVTGYTRNGIVLHKIEKADGPDTPVVPGRLVLRDFIARRTGDVAVASFFHDRDTPYYGQTLHQTYRSMEIWIKRGDAWKMISSQGCQMAT